MIDSGHETVLLNVDARRDFSLLTEEEVGEEVLHVLVELILRRQQNRLVVEEQQQQGEQEKHDNASHPHLSFRL